MKQKLFFSFFIIATLFLFNVAAANAQTIQWGPIQHGVFTPYYDSSTNSDAGFDLSTGHMTTDPANRDFILYQGLWMVRVKGVEFLGEELLTTVSDEPVSLVNTDDWLLTDMTYLIRCQDNTYAKLIVTKETPEGVEFDYVLQKGAQVPGTITSCKITPGTATTPGTSSPGTTTPGVSGPATIINNTSNVNQNTNTTTNNANTITNISGSIITNSNIGSNNHTSQTSLNNNAITVTQYVNVIINGQPLQSDVKPFVNADGRTMLPIRAISEALGAQVQWDNATQTATLTQGEKIVKVPIGQKNIDVNGKQFAMDTAAVVKDGRTLLPVRAVGEALGAKIGWDQQTGTVSIEPLLPGLSASSGLKIEPTKINSIIGNAHNQFNQLTKVNKLSPADAISQQITSLRLQPDVDRVEQLPDSSNLKVRFKDGYELVMLQGEEAWRGGLMPSTSTINPPAVTPGTIIPEVDSKLLPAPISGVTSSLDPGIPDKINIKIDDIMNIDPHNQVLTGLNAVIFDATADDPREMSELDSKISNQLEEMGYHTDVYNNDEATLSRLAQIDSNNLGVVVIIGHGCVVGSDFYFVTRPWYDSPPPADSGYEGTMAFSCTNGATGQTQYLYAVGSQFAQTYWTNEFPGTMFVFDACQSSKPAGIPGLPTWALYHGASFWLGWDNNVTFNNGDLGTLRFFEKLNDWKTVNQAKTYVNANVHTPPSLSLVRTSSDANSMLTHLFWDVSEFGDGQDFLLMKAEEKENQLLVRVYFSDSYSSTEFYMYFDNDGNGVIDTTVKCTPAAYQIYSVRNSPPIPMGSGTPLIDGSRYEMALPRYAVGSINKFYLSEWSNGNAEPKDRMPDSGWYSR